MSLAFKRLKNLGWLALVCLVAVLLYPLSLNVASLHSDLVEIDGQILETKREIDFLEAELKTRASLGQLEEWNELLYGYRPPTAKQFLQGERALAELANRDRVRKPVLVAVSSGGVGPAGIIGSGRPTAQAGEKPMNDTEKKKLEDNIPARQELVSTEQGRTERLAQMEQQLLSDNLLDEIDAQSAKEKNR